jgi:hypothetical protein
MRSTTLRGSAATAANPCPVHPTCLEVHSFEILNKYRSPGHETASPEYSGSWNSAQKRIRMKDVLFHNFFGKKGHKTASAPCPTETLRGICPSALFRPTALPRGILHLIKFGIRNSCTKQHSWHDFPSTDNIRGTGLRGSFYAEEKRRQKYDRGSLKQHST